MEIAIVPTACGIETPNELQKQNEDFLQNCNSTYRLRY